MKHKLDDNIKGMLSSLLVSIPVTTMLWFFTSSVKNLPNESIPIVVACVSFVGISLLGYKRPKSFISAAAFLGLIVSIDI